MNELSESQRAVLLEFAGRYIWWKSPPQALAYPQRVVAQVMNIGDWDDVLKLARLFDQEALKEVLKAAEAGQFSARSWHFWHYRLRLATMPEEVPPLPPRFPPND